MILKRNESYYNDEHGDRPRPVPDIPELKKATNLFMRTKSIMGFWCWYNLYFSSLWHDILHGSIFVNVPLWLLIHLSGSRGSLKVHHQAHKTVTNNAMREKKRGYTNFKSHDGLYVLTKRSVSFLSFCVIRQKFWTITMLIAIVWSKSHENHLQLQEK